MIRCLEFCWGFFWGGVVSATGGIVLFNRLMVLFNKHRIERLVPLAYSKHKRARTAEVWKLWKSRVQSRARVGCL